MSLAAAVEKIITTGNFEVYFELMDIIKLSSSDLTEILNDIADYNDDTKMFIIDLVKRGAEFDEACFKLAIDNNCKDVVKFVLENDHFTATKENLLYAVSNCYYEIIKHIINSGVEVISAHVFVANKRSNESIIQLVETAYNARKQVEIDDDDDDVIESNFEKIKLYITKSDSSEDDDSKSNLFKLDFYMKKPKHSKITLTIGGKKLTVRGTDIDIDLD